MRKTIKSLEQEIRYLEKHNQELRFESNRKQDEINRLRAWAMSKFDWWIELMSDQKTPCLKYLIKNTAELLGMKK